MMTTRTKLRRSALALLLLLASAALPESAPASFIFTLTQTAGNVVVTGSGSINTAGLAFLGNSTFGLSGIAPSSGLLETGVANTTLSSYAGFTGPANFGTGAFLAATINSGDDVGIRATAQVVGPFTIPPSLFLPAGYVSGSLLANTETFTNATFSSLGFTPGTYTYSFGTGASADSLVITSVVPEPSTWALLGLGAGLLGLTLHRRRVRLA